jgi:hypothetical protein
VLRSIAVVVVFTSSLFLLDAVLSPSSAPAQEVGDEISVEGVVSVSSCLPVAVPICGLDVDSSSDEYRLLEPDAPGSIALTVRCLQLVGERVRVSGTLAEWACDPIEGFGGIGIAVDEISVVQPPPSCGDTNRDGDVDISDPVHLLDYLFLGGPAPDPLRFANVNGNGGVDVSDVVYLLDYLFQGGPEPACPEA